jgi:steroid delta-isomerase-like uncharacterized protein
MSQFVAVSIALLLSGCADKGAENNASIARSFMEAWSAHDLDGLTSLFADDCLYEEVASGRTYTTKEGIAEYARATIAGVPDTEFAIVTVVADSRVAAVEWVWRGTNTVGWPSMGLPASGRAFELRGLSIIEIEDGLIVRASDYWDWSTFMEVIGVE